MNRNGVIFFNETNVYLLPLIRKCPDGEIGRRTVFRSQRSQGCAGSNPVPGTSQNFWRFVTGSPFLFSVYPAPVSK